MRRFLLSECGDRGWFVGPFEKSIHKTNDFEVAYGFNKKGDHSPKHKHKVALEINLVTHGSVQVNGEVFNAGQGFIMESGDHCECVYLEDTHTLVIKTPAVPNDKYYI